MKVFLSYSRRDTEFVERLDKALTEQGHQVWLDQEAIVGSGDERWRRTIVKAIRESDAVILVLSPNSTSSESVERELTVAAENSKRVVPVMYRQCTLPDGFQYELAGIQYVDFTAYDFDEGVRRLDAQLGPTTETTAAGHEAPPRDDDEQSDAVTPGRWTERRVLLGVVGAAAALLVIGGGIFALTSTGGDTSTGATTAPAVTAEAATIATTVKTEPLPTAVSPPSTTPPATSTPPASPQEQATALVTAWADATTRRDFTEAARIDSSRTAADLETLYGSADAPVRMVSVQPYIAGAVPDGPLWRLTGASFAYDYNPEPTIRTHVICSEWVVDLAASRLAWNPGKDAFFEGQQIPADQFADVYASTCTSPAG
jgi:hypothetical protein